jgi:hypothetical protein
MKFNGDLSLLKREFICNYKKYCVLIPLKEPNLCSTNLINIIKRLSFDINRTVSGFTKIKPYDSCFFLFASAVALSQNDSVNKQMIP